MFSAIGHFQIDFFGFFDSNSTPPSILDVIKENA